MLTHPKILYHKEIITIINTLQKDDTEAVFTPEDHPLTGIKANFKAQLKCFKIAFEYDRFAPKAKLLKKFLFTKGELLGGL